jgi:hypothetical protein
MVRHLADLLQILCDTGDEVSRLLVIVEPERQFLEVVKNAAAHFGLYRDAEYMSPVVHNELQTGIEQVDEEQARRRAENQSPVLTRQKYIYIALDRQGKYQFKQAGNHGTGKVQNK